MKRIKNLLARHQRTSRTLDLFWLLPRNRFSMWRTLLLATFVLVPLAPAQQPPKGFDTCTLNLFSVFGIVKPVTFSSADGSLQSLPGGVQQASIPNMSDPKINFDKMAAAYTLTCQTTSGAPAAQIYLTVEQFCTQPNFGGPCFGHTGQPIVSRVPQGASTGYQLVKAHFSLPQSNAYSSFYLKLVPRSQSSGNPCFLSNLGAAGSFSILGISGGSHNNPQVQFQSSMGGTGTIGVGANAELRIKNKVDLTNAVFEDPAAQVKIDGNGSISGSETQEPFAAIQSAVLAASSTAAALLPTQTFNRQIQNTTTITGNGGQNVISVTNHINLNNGQNLIISGGPSDTFIFNIAPGQDFQVENGSSIILQGGVSPSQVMFNFLGKGAKVSIESSKTGTSNSAGIFLDLNGEIEIEGGTHNSVFVSANQIQIQDNPTVNVIACP
jgi:hypothetical protein